MLIVRVTCYFQIPASFEGVVEQMEAARGPLEYGKQPHVSSHRLSERLRMITSYFCSSTTQSTQR